MVGGIHVRVEWEGAFSITVVGSIAFGCNDPVLEIKQKEVEDPTSSALSVTPKRRHWSWCTAWGQAEKFGNCPSSHSSDAKV